jgi:hypothetical protein
VAVLAILHSIATTQAALTLFRQRAIADDESALAQLFRPIRKVAKYPCAASALQLRSSPFPLNATGISFAMSHRSLNDIFVQHR